MTRWFVVSLVSVFVTASVMGYVVFVQPDLLREKIPTHWDIHMQPDAWTDRDGFVWVLGAFPAFMLFMVLLMAVLPRISPKNFEVDRFADTFGFALTSIIVFFGYFGMLVLWEGIEEQPRFAQFFVAGFFVLFAVLGNVMGKVQRNFWLGVRTPWTLASDTVWHKTHRLAAWLWVFAGILGGCAILGGMPFWIGFVLILVAALYPALYSLILYKSLEKQGKL